MHLLEDGKSIFFEIPQLNPVMQFHLYLELKTRDGRAFKPDIYYSIFHQGEDFTGYRASDKNNGTTSPIPTKARSIRGCSLGKHMPKSCEMKKYWPRLNKSNSMRLRAFNMRRGN